LPKENSFDIDFLYFRFEIHHTTFMKRSGLLLSVIIILNSMLNTLTGQVTGYLELRSETLRNITLLENQKDILPLRRLDTLRMAAVSVGASSTTPFQSMVGNYVPVDYINIPAFANDSVIAKALKKLKVYNLVIIGVHGNIKAANYLANVVSSPKIVAYFCDTASFLTMQNITASAVIASFRNDELTQELSAQIIFGGVSSTGRLSSTVGNYPYGAGISIEQPLRLGYSIPEDVGINSALLSLRIDSIVRDAITQQAFPGCNILVARDGKIVFHQTYGYHTYDNIIPTSKNDIYDLASVTKVSSALPAMMKLHGEGKLDLDERFSTYWPDWQKSLFHRSNKEDITLRELLAHQAGLVPFIKFWEKSQKDGKVRPRWYRVEEDGDYTHMVTPGMFLKDDFRKYVYKTIRLSPLKDRGKYVYSDLFFVMSPELIQNVSGKNYINYLDSCFYKPLGAGTITYQPTKKFSIDRIVPTEKDEYYRKRLLQGSVHDEAAAVLGGISGNAGLFGSANDLAKLLQMYLNEGTYGGEQYIREETFREFNRVQFPQNNNRRALGFDKPLPNNSTLSLKDSYPSPSVSPESFGHSGYTGTFFWVDPKQKLVYIMLANRVYPNRSYNKLLELSIRTKVQQAIYDSLEESKK
jgi:CubicO group peptidase (beta-lactamase class C family)